ncbi:hypothetical protein IQ07DRAFT_648252 [Pyrenochaeta sp. DS3sAY3a]|nr:hypothetical protein IQ07DRAFT_648252 [Pyrenochaeta sp. DS3sAY3a]
MSDIEQDSGSDYQSDPEPNFELLKDRSRVVIDENGDLEICVYDDTNPPNECIFKVDSKSLHFPSESKIRKDLESRKETGQTDRPLRIGPDSIEAWFVCFVYLDFSEKSGGPYKTGPHRKLWRFGDDITSMQCEVDQCYVSVTNKTIWQILHIIEKYLLGTLVLGKFFERWMEDIDCYYTKSIEFLESLVLPCFLFEDGSSFAQLTQYLAYNTVDEPFTLCPDDFQSKHTFRTCRKDLVKLLTRFRKCVRTSFKEGIKNATREFFHFAEDMPYPYISQAVICEHQKGYMTKSFLDCNPDYEYFQLNWSEDSLQSLLSFNDRLRSRATEENCFFCKQLKVLQAEVQRMGRVQSKDGLCLTCIKDEFSEYEMALYFKAFYV